MRARYPKTIGGLHRSIALRWRQARVAKLQGNKVAALARLLEAVALQGELLNRLREVRPHRRLFERVQGGAHRGH